AFSLFENLLRLLQGAMDYCRRLLLLRVEIEIARRNCETGILAHGWQHNNLRIESEVTHHALDNHCLLRVLLTKECGCGPSRVQQNGYDLSHAAKMTGARLSFEQL